jgi:16S rRNA (uracil1498-N3)-methyltransferase
LPFIGFFFPLSVFSFIISPMERRRFYCNPITESAVELTGRRAHHLTSVLRLKAGQKVELFDGDGRLATAAVLSTTNHNVTLQIEGTKVTPKPEQNQIIIAASIAKGARFDWLIAKCTELGTDRLTPVIFERTVKQPKNPKTAARWQNLAIAAAKQSRRLFLPHIDPPLGLEQAVKKLKADHPNARVLLGSLDASCPSILETPVVNVDTIAFIGPEGGLTQQEKTFLLSQSAEPVRITDTVLRVETAAIAAAAILTTKRAASKL